MIILLYMPIIKSRCLSICVSVSGKLCHTCVSCLNDISNVITSSSSVNISQPVGDEASNTFVQTYDWAHFLDTTFKKIKGIKDKSNVTTYLTLSHHHHLLTLHNLLVMKPETHLWTHMTGRTFWTLPSKK